MQARQTQFLVLAGVTAALVVAAFWAVAVMLPMGFMPEEYAMWRTRKDMITGCQLSPVIIQGDSRAAAGFLPSRIGNAVNVSFGGASPVETFYASQAILRCKSTPGRVILSISPGLFVESQYFWPRSVLFGFLSFGQLEEIRKASRSLGDTTFYGPPKVGDWEAMLDNRLHAALFPSYYTSYIINHLVVGRWRENRAARAQTLATNGQHGYGMADGSSDLRAFRPSTLLNSYLERLLDSYAARGTPVDFIAVPMNQSTYERMSPAVIEAFQAYLDKLAATHPNFHVVGRAVNPMDDAYFGDSTHLNARGAEVFSDRVKTLLAEPGSTAL